MAPFHGPRGDVCAWQGGENCAAGERLKEKPLLGTQAGVPQRRSIQETFNSLLKSRRTGSCHLVSDGSRKKGLFAKRGKLGACWASDCLERAPLLRLSELALSSDPRGLTLALGSGEGGSCLLAGRRAPQSWGQEKSPGDQRWSHHPPKILPPGMGPPAAGSRPALRLSLSRCSPGC